jgi:alginate O-acetyltransferase complex protein AlgI
MLFYSPFALFLFLPLVFALYWAAGWRHRNLVLLAASAFFYAWGEPRFFLVAIASALADYFIGARIHAHAGSRVARAWLALGVVLNVGLLAYYKYFNFFVDNLNLALTHWGMAPVANLDILLPIGVSFIVFEKITYLVDLYRRRGHPAGSVASYMLYVFFFPKLLAGPIIKYHDIEYQIERRSVHGEDFAAGLTRFVLGMAKKLFIADTCGEVADAVFGLPPGQASTQQAWLGALAFTFQIYFDFSAYSDMAIGLARMMGFRLLENFHYPYAAASFTDFWHRWHISLSSWIREYLYIPLGGNRHGPLRTYFNLWASFLLSGLWHGASWNFVLWGAWNGLFLTLDKLFLLRLTRAGPRILPVAATFFLVVLGWVVFRSGSLEQTVAMLHAMFVPTDERRYLYVKANQWFFLGLAALLCVVPWSGAYRRLVERYKAWRWRLAVENVALGAAAWLAIGKVFVAGFNPFLYFRF